MPRGFYQGRPARRFAGVIRWDGTPTIERLDGPIVGCCAVEVQAGPSDSADISSTGERAVEFLVKHGVISSRDEVVQLHVRLDRTVDRDEIRIAARTTAPPHARIGLATRAKIAATNRRRASQHSAA